jgi:hypothetical protein
VNEIRLAAAGSWNVLTAGLLFGAGLPILFALAVRAQALGTDTVAEDGTTTFHRSFWGRVLATALMLVLVGAVVLGITLIVASGFGKAVDFSHVIPMIVDKKK